MRIKRLQQQSVVLNNGSTKCTSHNDTVSVANTNSEHNCSNGGSAAESVNCKTIVSESETGHLCCKDHRNNGGVIDSKNRTCTNITKADLSANSCANDSVKCKQVVYSGESALDSKLLLECSKKEPWKIKTNEDEYHSGIEIGESEQVAFENSTDEVHVTMSESKIFREIAEDEQALSNNSTDKVTVSGCSGLGIGENDRTPSDNCADEVTVSSHRSGLEVDENKPTMSDNSAGEVLGYENILDEFALQDLQMMIVKNKHGDDVLFCDTGVYTKNRNFRLYKSSKLGQNNPLILAERNTYTPPAFHPADQQIFYDSLVSNVQFTDKLRVLTFGEETDAEATRPGTSSKHGHRDKGGKGSIGETLEGYSKSPYPEVDDFINGLVSEGGAVGGIRHWTYFQQGELLLYEISRYRYCHNIGRPHKSNNVMYIADLRRGLYYQKCHDPECQEQNFKSQEWPLPREVLPGHYFDDGCVDDSLEFQSEDEDFLNTTAEMEKQYYGDTSQNMDVPCELDDHDDEELSKAADDIENSFHSN